MVRIVRCHSTVSGRAIHRAPIDGCLPRHSRQRHGGTSCMQGRDSGPVHSPWHHQAPSSTRTNPAGASACRRRSGRSTGRDGIRLGCRIAAERGHANQQPRRGAVWHDGSNDDRRSRRRDRARKPAGTPCLPVWRTPRLDAALPLRQARSPNPCSSDGRTAMGGPGMVKAAAMSRARRPGPRG